MTLSTIRQVSTPCPGLLALDNLLHSGQKFHHDHTGFQRKR